MAIKLKNTNLKIVKGSTFIKSVMLGDKVIYGVAIQGPYNFSVHNNEATLVGLAETGKQLSIINIPQHFHNFPVVMIDHNAFINCKQLTSITLPKFIKTIGENAFRGCTGLTSITLPNSVEQICKNAFYGCFGLVSSIIPFGIKLIGDGAFAYCNWATSITIPSSVGYIGNGAFIGYRFPSITLPFVGVRIDDTSITHFGWIFGASSYSDNASYVPASLKTVVITGGTNIGYGAFYECSGLTSITIPSSVTSIGYRAFGGCSGLTTITVDAGNTKFRSTGNCIVETATKTLIAGCKNSVIPTDGSVLNIGYGAFYECSGLTSVIVPDSVTNIGSNTFYNCSGLTSITLPFVGETLNNSTSKPHFGHIFGAIDSNSNASYVPISLKTVVITGGTYIGKYAFKDCRELESVTIPYSVTNIGADAFFGCGRSYLTINCEAANQPSGWADGWAYGSTVIWGYNNIKTDSKYDYVLHGDEAYLTKYKGTETVVTIPNTIGGYMVVGFGTIFSGNTTITSVTIPASVTNIEEYAFKNCSGLTSIDILNGVTSIKYAAFWNCTKLTTITIPVSVTNIELSVFHNTVWLNNQPDGLIYAGKVAYKYKGTMPQATAITLRDDTTGIGGNAFLNCPGLYSITIPNTVISVGSSAFDICPKLTKINCRALSQPTGWHANWKGDCTATVVWGYKGV